MNFENYKYPTFASPEFKPEIKNLTNEEYHADKSALSSSSLKPVLKSPLTFITQYNHVYEPTSSQKFGTAFHMALLEYDLFKKKAVIEKKFNGTGSRNAKEEWLRSLDADSILLTESELKTLEGMLNSVHKRNDLMNLLNEGYSEQSLFFKDEQTNLLCKARPDHYNPVKNCLVDIKTTQDCSINEFSKSVWNYRYDIQSCFYKTALEQVYETKVEYITFLCVEKEEPYETSIYIADDGMIGKGEEDMNQALYLISESLKKNEWNPYQKDTSISKIDVPTIYLPSWAFNS